jgi:acyl-CoA thioester hydrolase
MSGGPVFVRSRAVRESEIDEIGHVNNVAWLERVIALASAHSVAAGLRFEDYVRIGGFLVVRRHVIDYLQSARLGDVLIEETWLSRMHAARTVRHARFWREGDGALVLAATTDWAWVERETLRARRIPQEVLARFTVLEEEPAPPVPTAPRRRPGAA